MLWITMCFQLMPTETKPKAVDAGLFFFAVPGRHEAATVGAGRVSAGAQRLSLCTYLEGQNFSP